ncbi:MAG: class I SAM-dependent methyltransferase [Solirubrobacterales bacterium]
MVGRRVLFRSLASLRGGRIEIVEGVRRFAFGHADADLCAEVEVHDQRAYGWTLRGSTGWGEGYVDRLWSCGDLVTLTRIATRNLVALDRWNRRLNPLLVPLRRAAGLVPRNTRAGARRNISSHYDLGNALFEAFLDERMVYSCAYFPRSSASLAEAQTAKLERICDRLELGAEDHLLEIGAGWGGLAIFAASNYGCRVTTTTISREQHALATERVRDAGLTDRVTVLLRDYRDLDGTYDKLASIEMIEAVGWQYFPTFFARCSSLLRADGAMFLQAIVIDDAAYESEKAARSFANTHVFPGGCLPSQRLIGELVEERTDMSVAWLEDISDHYVATLRAWREHFDDAWPQLRALGYDRRFARLWNFYLATSEAGFRERRIRDLQLLIAKPGWRAAGPERPRSPTSITREPAPASPSS